jgi:hypothetical protein
MQDELIRQAMRALAARRWAKASAEDRKSAGAKMAAGRRKARLARRAARKAR